MTATDNNNYKLYTKKIKYQFKLQYKFTVIIVKNSKKFKCKLVRKAVKLIIYPNISKLKIK